MLIFQETLQCIGYLFCLIQTVYLAAPYLFTSLKIDFPCHIIAHILPFVSFSPQEIGLHVLEFLNTYSRKIGIIVGWYPIAFTLFTFPDQIIRQPVSHKFPGIVPIPVHSAFVFVLFHSPLQP